MSPVLILHCCPLVFTPIALIKSLIYIYFFIYFCHNWATLHLRDIHYINNTINRFVYCWPASIVGNISSLLMRNDWLLQIFFFFVRNSKWLISYSSHTLLSFTPYSLSHTHSLFIFTVARHTFCLDTSLYTNCQWIHSDARSAQTPQTAGYCSHLHHHPSSSCLHLSHLHLLPFSSLLHLFLLCFTSLKNPLRTHWTMQALISFLHRYMCIAL